MKINLNKQRLLTFEYLRKILGYDLLTGIFVWKVKLNKRHHNGMRAGSNGRYIDITIDGYKYAAHRLAWFYVFGKWPANLIDHIDRNKTNNRIDNLRLATASENHRNRKKNINNTTGFTGVCWNEFRRKYCASITVNRKQINLGRFDNIISAIDARQLAELKYDFIGE